MPKAAFCLAIAQPFWALIGEAVNTDTDAPAKPAPLVTPEMAPFWEACAKGRLMLQHCADCGHRQFYPRLLCAACGGRGLNWLQACGRGQVKSWTIIRRAVSQAFAADAPYVVALIELAEGPTMMSNIIGCDPASITIGQPVRVTFEARGPNIALPLFERDDLGGPFSTAGMS